MMFWLGFSMVLVSVTGITKILLEGKRLYESGITSGITPENDSTGEIKAYPPIRLVHSNPVIKKEKEGIDFE